MNKEETKNIEAGDKNSATLGQRFKANQTRSKRRRDNRIRNLEQKIGTMVSDKVYSTIRGKPYSELEKAYVSKESSDFKDLLKQFNMEIQKLANHRENESKNAKRRKTNLLDRALSTFDVNKFVAKELPGYSSVEEGLKSLQTNVGMIVRNTGLTRHEVLELMAMDDFWDFLKGVGNIVSTVLPVTAPFIKGAQMIGDSVKGAITSSRSKTLGKGRNVGMSVYDDAGKIGLPFSYAPRSVFKTNDDILHTYEDTHPGQYNYAGMRKPTKVEYDANRMDIRWVAQFMCPTNYKNRSKPTDQMVRSYPGSARYTYQVTVNTTGLFCVIINPDAISSATTSTTNAFIMDYTPTLCNWNPNNSSASAGMSTGSVTNATSVVGPQAGNTAFGGFFVSNFGVTIKPEASDLNASGQIIASQMSSSLTVNTNAGFVQGLNLAGMQNATYRVTDGKSDNFMRYFPFFNRSFNTMGLQPGFDNYIIAAGIGMSPGSTVVIFMDYTVDFTYNPASGQTGQLYAYDWPESAPATSSSFVGLLRTYPWLMTMDMQTGAVLANGILACDGTTQGVAEVICADSEKHAHLTAGSVKGSVLNLDLLEKAKSDKSEISYDKLSE